MKRFLIFFLLCCAPVFAGDDPLKNARTLMSEKKYEEALQALTEYEKTHPEDLKAHELIQRAYSRLNQNEKALQVYKKRSEDDPSAFNTYLYARLLDSPVEQEKIYRGIIEKDPASVWGYYGLGNALLEQDRLQEAAGEARAGLSLVKSTARIHYVLARIYRRMDDFPRAADHARQTYKLEPTEEYLDFSQGYEWLEVSNTKALPEKFVLAKRWFEKYRDTLLKPGSLYDCLDLAEVAFIYADHGSDPETVAIVVAPAIKKIGEIEVPKEGEDLELYTRMKGSLYALQAWSDAMQKHGPSAITNLQEASKVGLGPETFYFSALAYRVLGQKEEALRSALKAATFPPVYSRSSEIAETIWKELHGSNEGLSAALKIQGNEFAPQRKAKVIAQTVNETYPPFTIIDVNGNKMTEKDLKGKVVLLNFWAVWCPPCREELPHWNEFYSKHKEDPDLLLLAVGDEPWETMLNYMKNQKYSFPLYRNEDYWDQFKIDGIPTMLVIDPSGIIRFRNGGFEAGMDYAQTLEWQIEAARADSFSGK